MTSVVRDRKKWQNLQRLKDCNILEKIKNCNYDCEKHVTWKNRYSFNNYENFLSQHVYYLNWCHLTILQCFETKCYIDYDYNGCGYIGYGYIGYGCIGYGCIGYGCIGYGYIGYGYISLSYNNNHITDILWLIASHATLIFEMERLTQFCKITFAKQHVIR
jgi:hypothetical protein